MEGQASLVCRGAERDAGASSSEPLFVFLPAAVQRPPSARPSPPPRGCSCLGHVDDGVSVWCVQIPEYLTVRSAEKVRGLK